MNILRRLLNMTQDSRLTTLLSILNGDQATIDAQIQDLSFMERICATVIHTRQDATIGNFPKFLEQYLQS